MDLKVHINNIHGSQMAAKINGIFTLDSHEFHFTAIAFGRIGGQNVGAKLSKSTETELEKLGYDVEEVIMKITTKFTSRGSYSSRRTQKRIFCR